MAWVCDAGEHGKLNLFQIGLLLGTEVAIPEFTFINPAPKKEAKQIADLLVDQHGLVVLRFSYYEHTHRILYHLAHSERKENTTLRSLRIHGGPNTHHFRWMCGFFKTFTGLHELSIPTRPLDYLDAHDIGTLVLARPDSVLTRLNLSFNDTMGDRGIASLCTALENNTVLTELNLSQCVVTPSSADFVKRMVSTNTTLHSLILERLTAGTTDPEPFVRNGTLRTLNLGINRFTASQLSGAYKALEFNTSLTTLCLSRDINVSTTAVPVQPDVLRLNSTLTDLDIAHWNLSTQSFSAIVGDLTANASLTRIVLANDHAGRQVSAAELAPLFARNRTLRVFECGKLDLGIPYTPTLDLLAIAVYKNPVILSIGEQFTNSDAFAWSLMRNKKNLERKSTTLLEIMLKRDIITNNTLKRQRIK